MARDKQGNQVSRVSRRSAAAPVRRAARAAVEALEGRTLFHTFSGHVFFDANNNHVFDAGDPRERPLEGFSVRLADIGVTHSQTTATDKSGAFTFNTSDDACYDVVFDANSAFYEEYSVTLPSGTVPNYSYGTFPAFGSAVTHTNLDFGVYSKEGPPDTGYRFRKCRCDGSAMPVRYADGQMYEGVTDLASDGFGAAWGRTRTWSNSLAYDQGGTNGNGWVMDELPNLVVSPGGDAVGVLFTATGVQWFDGSTGGPYAPRHDATESLTYGPAEDDPLVNEFVFTADDGTQIRFHDFDAGLPLFQQGGFKSQRDPAGNRIAVAPDDPDPDVSGHDAEGRVQDLRRTVTAGGVTTVESWKYEYIPAVDENDDPVPNAGKLALVTLRRSTDGGSTWSPVRKVAYSYYEGTSSGEYSYGTLGDLRTAQVQDAAGAAIDTWYYRYYRAADVDAANGFAGGLKYVLDPEAYARLTATLPSGTPLTASNPTVEAYATRYYQYDDRRRVSQEVVAGTAGSGGSGADGFGTYVFQYEENPAFDENARDHNAWKTKTTETLPDGSTNEVFTNFLGAVMLTVAEDGTGGPADGKRLATFHAYDADGRLKLTAHPSAFDPQGTALYCTASDDLLVDQGGGDYLYLGDDFGQVDLYEYASSTSSTISDTVAGDVEGLLKATLVRRGDYDNKADANSDSVEDVTDDNPVLLSTVSYYKHTYAPTGGVAATVHPVAAETVYPSAAAGSPGTGRTTDYAYTWHADVGAAATNRPASVTVERPLVSESRNGPGGSARDTDVTVFDARGNPTWSKDATGFISYAAWDPATGAVVTSITDVDTTRTSTFTGLPAGWSTPSGGGVQGRHRVHLVRRLGPRHRGGRHVDHGRRHHAHVDLYRAAGRLVDPVRRRAAPDDRGPGRPARARHPGHRPERERLVHRLQGRRARGPHVRRVEPVDPHDDRPDRRRPRAPPGPGRGRPERVPRGPDHRGGAGLQQHVARARRLRDDRGRGRPQPVAVDPQRVRTGEVRRCVLRPLGRHVHHDGQRARLGLQRLGVRQPPPHRVRVRRRRPREQGRQPDRHDRPDRL